jgi:threonine dehydrogenase-like Zn-dependent dehydrogenase
MLGGVKFTVHRDGNMAQYFLVNDAQTNLAPIPDGLADYQAVYATDMLSTGFVGAEHAELEFGETVAVFAQGAVGLSATIGCRILDVGLITAVESQPERQELARRFGTDVIVDYTKGDPVEQILELTDGEGVDAAIEALGSPQMWDAAIRITKPGGRISNLGYHGEVPEPLKIPLEPFGMADKQIYGGLNRGGQRADAPDLPADGDRQGESHADDHSRVRLRRVRTSIQDDGGERGRDHQALIHFDQATYYRLRSLGWCEMNCWKG